MPKKSDVSIVIIAYGWSSRLRDFFADFPTVIIENNVAAERKKVVGARVVFNVENVGFSRAANQGAALSDSEYILFLNDDCDITTAQIEALVKEAVQKKWQAISPTLIDAHGTTQTAYQQSVPSFLSLVIDWTPLHHLVGKLFHSEARTLPGGCLLIRRQTLKKLGDWDERFWLWWEDVDLSYRMKKMGVSFGISDHVRVKHIGGESFAPLADTWKKQVFFHSLRLFAEKHFPKWQAKVIHLITQRFDAHYTYPRKVI